MYSFSQTHRGPTLQTPRLLLRPIVREDAADIYAYSRTADVGPLAGWKPHESIRETRKVMKQIFLGQKDVFGIAQRSDGRIIGSIGLIADPKRDNDRVRMLGYALSQAHWGKGYMTEAAQALLHHGWETLCIDLISAYCYPFNRRSAHVLEKCGFAYEGMLKLAEKRYDGQVLDNLCYALPRPDAL